ncbi:MAG: hypothetical protein ACREQ7_25375 [Candidatus Binatia bacterium]
MAAAKRKTQSNVVDIQKSTEEKFWAQERKEDDQCPGPDPKKVDAVISEIIETINDFVDGTAFHFFPAEAGQVVKPFADETVNRELFGDGFNLAATAKMRWHATINPRYALLIRRRSQYLDTIDEAIAAENVEASFAASKMSDLSGELMSCVEELAFYVGTLMGAKLIGASTEQIVQLGQRLRRAIV